MDFNLPSNWWVSLLRKSEFAVPVLGFQKLWLELDNYGRATKNAYCRIYSLRASPEDKLCVAFRAPSPGSGWDTGAPRAPLRRLPSQGRCRDGHPVPHVRVIKPNRRGRVPVNQRRVMLASRDVSRVGRCADVVEQVVGAVGVRKLSIVVTQRGQEGSRGGTGRVLREPRVGRRRVRQGARPVRPGFALHLRRHERRGRLLSGEHRRHVLTDNCTKPRSLNAWEYVTLFNTQSSSNSTWPRTSFTLHDFTGGTSQVYHKPINESSFHNSTSLPIAVTKTFDQ